MRRSFLFFAAAALGLLAVLPGISRAQVNYSDRPKLPSTYQHAIEEYNNLHQQPTETIREVEAIPIKDSAGRQLVGIVENRTLTKPQMDLRVNLILQNQPQAKDADEALRRRVSFENRVVSDWAEASALAVLGERLGYKAAPEEINKALADLAAQNSTTAQPNQILQPMRMQGIPDEDLRRELADGIVIEKMLHDEVARVSDDQLKAVFAKVPSVFLEPTRVKAWKLVCPLVNSADNVALTPAQLSAKRKVFLKYSKQLSKCRTQADYDKLKKDIGADQGVALIYLDNVGADEPLAPALSKALFELKPGKTSDLIVIPEPPAKPIAFQAVKVLEHKDGQRGTFEEAKPQVQNYMIGKLKDVLYEGMKDKYKIRIDPSGLNDFKELARYTPPPTAPGPAPASNPAPVAARPAGGAHPLLAPGSVPSVESVVGAPAEIPAPAPGSDLVPSPGAPPPAAPLPSVLAAGDQSTSAATAMDAPPPFFAPAPAPAPAPATRKKKAQPPRNFNAIPPSVDEVLSRPAPGR